MFSEYASRFLAQSQSRLSLPGGPAQERQNQRSQNDSGSRNTSSRQGRGTGNMNPSNSRFATSSRQFFQRNMPSPYNQTGGSQHYSTRFPLGSRTPASHAPLFYSATDEFREENNGEEHEREFADHYALQRSRAQFTSSKISESSDVDDYGGIESSLERSAGDDALEGDKILESGMGRGIRSSWKGDRIGERGRTPAVQTLHENAERGESRPVSASSLASERDRGRLVNVDLASTMRDSLDDIRKEDLIESRDGNPPAIQMFNDRPRPARTIHQSRYGYGIPEEEEVSETARLNPRSTSPDRESVPADAEAFDGVPDASPRHDQFWGTLFWICLSMFFATSLLIWLHTSVPSRIGDTIYATLHKSFFQLAVYTVVAVFVSQIWLALLRHHAKALITTMLVAVPTILLSFSIYTFVSSYKVQWAERSWQDEAMRWFSLLPFTAAFVWIFTVYRSRHVFNKATEILEFSCKLLTAHPALLLVGFAHLAIFTLWTWLWIILFARLFLTGHLGLKNLWVISGTAWALGVFYTLMYLWTIGVLAGIQRSITAATVSQWYFHRNAQTTPHSRAIVQASLSHATGVMYGTICLSSLLTLIGRLPLLVLPRRLAGMFSLCFYSLIPTPILSLTNPLALTYASIYSRPLSTSARELSHMSFVDRIAVNNPNNPNHHNATNGFAPAPRPIRQYALAKLLLHATRYVAVAALGFGGWVSSAQSLDLSQKYKGSIYAYVVGLMSAAIGWGVLGAMEGVLGGIVDALVVCWGSETGGFDGAEDWAGTAGGGGGENDEEGGGRVVGGGGVGRRFCREAGELFGEERGRGW